MSEDEQFRKAFGKHIEGLREQKKLSYGELASRCDLEKGNLYNTLQGKKNATLVTIYKLAKGLDVPVKELFDFKFPA